jgi:hypothetical protein
MILRISMIRHIDFGRFYECHDDDAARFEELVERGRSRSALWAAGVVLV